MYVCMYQVPPPPPPPCKNHPGETQEGPGQNSTSGAGRFSPRQILHRPDRHTANHHQAVAGTADPTVLSVRRLPKGIQQCGLRHHLEAHATLRLPPPPSSFPSYTNCTSTPAAKSYTKRSRRIHSRPYRPVFVNGAYCCRPSSFWWSTGL